MGPFQPFGDLAADLQGFFKGEGSSAQPLGQSLALDELKDKKALAVGFFDNIDCGNIRGIER